MKIIFIIELAISFDLIGYWIYKYHIFHSIHGNQEISLHYNMIISLFKILFQIWYISEYIVV